MPDSLDILKEADALSQTLALETSQKTVARGNFEKVQATLLQESLVDAQAQAVLTQDVTGKQTDNINTMIRNLNQIDKINGSFKLQFMGLFDPELNPDVLLGRSALANKRNQLQSARLKTQKNALSAKQSVRRAKLANAAGAYDEETSDVEDIRQQIRDTREANLLTLQQEAVALETEPMERLRASKRFTDVQLRDTERSRAAKETAFQSGQLAFQMKNMQMVEANRQLYLQEMGAVEVNRLTEIAKASPDKKAPVGSFSFDILDLANKQKELIAASKFFADQRISAAESAVGLESSAKQLQRIYGQNTNDTKTVIERYQALATDDNAAPSVRSKAAGVVKALEEVAKTQTDQQAISATQDVLNKQMLALSNAAFDDKLSEFPDEQRTAAKEFLMKDQFTSETNAEIFIPEMAARGISTGNTYLDEVVAQTNLKDHKTSIFTKEEIQNIEGAFTQKGDAGGAAAINTLLQDQTKRDVLAQKTFESMRVDLYEKTAEALGDTELLRILRDPDNPANRSDRSLFDFLRARREKNSEAISGVDFAEAVRQDAFGFAGTALDTSGANAIYAGAVKKVIFDNQPEALFAVDTATQMTNAMSGGFEQGSFVGGVVDFVSDVTSLPFNATYAKDAAFDDR